MELDPAVIHELKTKESVVNYLHARINEVQQQIRSQPPKPTDPLTGSVYITWERTTLIKFGIAVGSVQAAQAFGLISVEVFQQFKTALIGTLLKVTSDVQMGIQTP